MTNNEVIKPPETGCYVDGHWGQYGLARVIKIAEDYGYRNDRAVSLAEKHLASMGPSNNPDLDADEMESLVWFNDDAIDWLNENASDPNHSWDWHDGEFYYQNTEWWAE